MTRATRTKPADAAPMRERLVVRTSAAFTAERRYRAGLGPFTREAQVVEVTPEQAEALRDDPMLSVAEAEE
jgi:hypothetical protein